MKTLTLRTSAVALAAATLCWHQASHAAATESQLRGVVLYGNVSIQEDSTASWGPWTEFEAPAAGNTQPVAAPTARTDPYRPLAQVGGGTTTPPINPPAETGCIGGTICGFGAFQAISDPNETEARVYTAQDIHPFRLNGTVLQASQGEGSSPLLPQTLQLDATTLATGTYLLPNSGALTLTNGDGLIGYTRYEETLTYEVLPDQYRSSSYDPEAVQAINFKAYLATYVEGKQSQSVWGVIGYTTPAADMSALRASNAQATYSGKDFYDTPVTLNVNFGNATWNGSWNGGVDGTVATQAAASGGTLLTGKVGFTAVGTIQGSNFTSTSVGTNDVGATVSGYVQGAFFGANAAAAGGVVDITKTRPATQQEQPVSAGRANPQGVVQPGQGYTNGRYVAPFLAVRNAVANNASRP
ncbi:MAG TPA: hypothetical protein H9903_14470 [Candidatus Aquabacterium excrementipullorum]|nr:hypothetical protein [Candidatus Aquabacterium excrementipullorum]